MPFDGLGSPVYSNLSYAAHDPGPYAVILETTTPEKVIQYQALAKKFGYPIQFRSLNEIVDAFHSVDEDKADRKKNSELKFLATINKADLFNNDLRYRNLLISKCHEWGIPYNPDNIIFAADDMTGEIDSRIWWGVQKGDEKKKPGLRKLLNHFVPEGLLRSAAKKKKDKSELAGPGAETGPILSATTAERFFNLFRHAAEEILGSTEAVKLRQAKTLTYMSLEDIRLRDRRTEAAPLQIDEHADLYVDFNWFKQKKMRLKHEPIVIEDYLKTTPEGMSPISDNIMGYLETASPHLAVIRALYNQLRTRPVKPVVRTSALELTIPNAPKKDFKVAQATSTIVEPASPNATFYDTLNIPEFEGADLIEFKIFDASDIKLLRKNCYKLLSACVDEQVTPKKRRIVIHNDGCWDSVLNLINEYIDMGMCKDFNQSTYEGGPLVRGNNVTHRASAYFDIITSQNESARFDAAEKVKSIRQQNFTPFRYPEGIDPLEKLHAQKAHDPDLRTKPDNQFTVAVFTSASNDNRKLNRTLENYGSFLGKNEINLVWGAGDRHAMGAVYKGYIKVRNKLKTWLGGFSTPQIVESETSKAALPDECDFPRKYSENIYRRMADMFDHSDMLVIAPGGPGTVQELLAFLRLQDEQPEKMRNKSLVFYSPDLHKSDQESSRSFYANTIKTLLGEDVWHQLSSQGRAMGNIYYARRYDGLTAITLNNKHEFNRRITRALTGKPIPAGARQAAPV